MTAVHGTQYGTSSQYDPDARNYLIGAGIVPGVVYAGDGNNDYPLNAERIVTGVTTFFKALKSNGLYSQIRYMYLFCGATQGENLVNMMKPGYKDLTTISPFSSTFGRNGIICNSSNMHTGVYMSEFDENSISIGIYVKSGGSNLFGTTDTASGTYVFGSSPPSVWFKQNSGGVLTIPTTTGFHQMNITASNRRTYYIKGSQVLLDTSAASSKHNADFREIWFSQINFSDAYQLGGSSNANVGFFYIGTGMSDSDSVTMGGLVEQLMYQIRGRDIGITTNNAFQFLGDSLTVSVSNVVATGYHPWPNHVCYHRNATQLNYAVGGTTIIDCNTTQISNLVAKDTNHTRVFIAFSTNDFGNDVAFGSGHTMTLSTFSSTYATVYGKILALGYSASDIVVITGYLINASQFDTALGGTGRGDALQDSYIAAAYTAARTAGIPDTNIFNLKVLAQNTGGSSEISGIHMTNPLHDICGEYISGALAQINF